MKSIKPILRRAKDEQHLFLSVYDGHEHQNTYQTVANGCYPISLTVLRNFMEVCDGLLFSTVDGLTYKTLQSRTAFK